MPTLSAMDFIVSWMFWLNGFGTRGMRNMLLPLSEDGSIASPGGVNSGRPLYLSTFAVTSADTLPADPPLDADPPDPDPVLHAVRARAATRPATAKGITPRFRFLITVPPCRCSRPGATIPNMCLGVTSPLVPN